MGASITQQILSDYQSLFLDSIGNDFYAGGRSRSIAGNGRVPAASVVMNQGTTLVGAYEGDKDTVPVPVERHTDETYTLYAKNFHTKPIFLAYNELKYKPYNKETIVKEEQIADLREKIANYMAFQLAPNVAANIFETTGTARLSALRDNATITGNRKSAASADWMKLARMANKAAQMFGGEVYGLINSYWLEDMKNIAQYVDFEKTGKISALMQPFSEPIKIFGINWIYRDNLTGSTGVQYRTDGTTKVNQNTTATVASDKGAVTIWCPAAFRTAIDPIDMRIEKDKTQVEGGMIFDLHTSVMAGANRSDYAGIYSMVEAASA
jgi:hypothetical protein